MIFNHTTDEQTISDMEKYLTIIVFLNGTK